MPWLFSLAVNSRKILEIRHPQGNKSISTKISVSVLFLHINTSLRQSLEGSQGLRTCGVRGFTQAVKLSNVYFQVIFDCEKCLVTIWALAGHSLPLCLTQDMPCLPWKLLCTDSTAMSKARWDIRSSSATLLEHGEVFCISAENRIFPLMQYAGSFLGKTEMRGRVSLNVEEMAECKEICDHTDQTNSVWVEITWTRDDKNCPSRILLRIFYSLLPLFKFECKLWGMQNYRKVITAILCLRKTLTSQT